MTNRVSGNSSCLWIKGVIQTFLRHTFAYKHVNVVHMCACVFVCGKHFFFHKHVTF